MLIRNFEASAKDGAVGHLRDGFKIEAVKGRQHSEFYLDGVGCGNGKRGKMIV